jgi:hypothetical protein
VRFDGAAVVRADLDIDADDPPRGAHRLEQRRVEDQRAPCATPVSMMTSGRKLKITSCSLRSSGCWMIGRPSQVKV